MGVQVTPTGKSAPWTLTPRRLNRPPTTEVGEGALVWVLWQHCRSPVLHWLAEIGACATARAAKEARVTVFNTENISEDIDKARREELWKIMCERRASSSWWRVEKIFESFYTRSPLFISAHLWCEKRASAASKREWFDVMLSSHPTTGSESTQKKNELSLPLIERLYIEISKRLRIMNVRRRKLKW